MQLYTRTLKLIIFFVLGLVGGIFAQDSSYSPLKDTLLNKTDSVAALGQQVADSNIVRTFNLDSFYLLNEQIPLNGPVSKYLEVPFDPSEKDYIFYIIVGMFVLLCILKLLFGKYLSDLIKLFSRQHLNRYQSGSSCCKIQQLH